MGHIAAALVPASKACLGYADRLLEGVTPELFRRMPPGVTTNSPAFNYGHLAIYPDRLLPMLGREDLAKPDERFMTLFSAQAVCEDDADGTRYPPMNEIVERFRSRHQALLPVIAETSDEVFAQENPNEKMRDRFPTLGVLTTFLLTAHMMMHLGQTSTWRRCVGLGPCMR